MFGLLWFWCRQMGLQVFEIFVVRAENEFQIFAQSPVGQREAKNVPPPNLQNQITALHNTIARSATRSSRNFLPAKLEMDADNRVIEEIGTILFSFLFPNDIESLYRSSLQSVRKTNDRLRIKLRMEEAQELSRVPWETLYDRETRTFLSSQLITLLTRGVDANDVSARKIRRINILGMVSGPKIFNNVDLFPLDPDEFVDILATSSTVRATDVLRNVPLILWSYRDFSFAMPEPRRVARARMPFRAKRGVY